MAVPPHTVATPLTWEADPLLCPKCPKEMRIISLIDYDTEPIYLSSEALA